MYCKQVFKKENVVSNEMNCCVSDTGTYSWDELQRYAGRVLYLFCEVLMCVSYISLTHKESDII